MTAASEDDLALIRMGTIAMERAAALSLLCVQAGVHAIHHLPCLPDDVDSTPRTDAFLELQRIATTTCRENLCLTVHSCPIEFQKLTPLPLLGPVMAGALIRWGSGINVSPDHRESAGFALLLGSVDRGAVAPATEESSWHPAS